MPAARMPRNSTQYQRWRCTQSTTPHLESMPVEVFAPPRTRGHMWRTRTNSGCLMLPTWQSLSHWNDITTLQRLAMCSNVPVRSSLGICQVGDDLARTTRLPNTGNAKLSRLLINALECIFCSVDCDRIGHLSCISHTCHTLDCGACQHLQCVLLCSGNTTGSSHGRSLGKAPTQSGPYHRRDSAVACILRRQTVQP